MNKIESDAMILQIGRIVTQGLDARLIHISELIEELGEHVTAKADEVLEVVSWKIDQLAELLQFDELTARVERMEEQLYSLEARLSRLHNVAETLEAIEERLSSSDVSGTLEVINERLSFHNECLDALLTLVSQSLRGDEVFTVLVPPPAQRPRTCQ